MYFVKKNDDKKSMNLMDEFQNIFMDSFFSSKALKTDIIENDKDYVLKVDLPGVDKKNIDLHFNNQYLTLAVHQEEEHEEKKNERYIRKERSSYSYSRSYYLEKADEQNVKAKLTDGILTIMVGKAEDQTGKKVISVE